jgi:hypothetical protein
MVRVVSLENRLLVLPRTATSLTQNSRSTLEPTHPPLQGVPGVKRPRREGEHSSPSSAEINNAWSYMYVRNFTLTSSLQNALCFEKVTDTSHSDKRVRRRDGSTVRDVFRSRSE